MFLQGSLEGTNIDIADTSTQMMSLARAYQIEPARVYDVERDVAVGRARNRQGGVATMTTLSLDAARSGVLSQQRNLELIANNLANVNTTGYKAATMHFQDLLDSSE